MRKFTIVGIGELLWDLFPARKQLGGAPANFAYISGLLGDDAIVVSRIGSDSLGDEALTRLRSLDLETSHIQRDDAHATGTVKIELRDDGQPQFEITQSVAWDYLEFSSNLEDLASKADATCFGSLAQRSPQSRKTIEQFLESTRKDAVRVFDVNLRQAFYSSEILVRSAEKADILKLNHDELPIMAQVSGGPVLSQMESARWLSQRFDLSLVCVTRGSGGSLIVTKDTFHNHPGHQVQVADTVGAGDAFTAALVHHYLRGSDLAMMNDAANRMGAWVASQPGATPPANPEVQEKVRVP